VRIVEVRIQELTPGSRRYFCVQAKRSSFYLQGGRDTALYGVFEGARVRWLVLANVIVGAPPNMARAMRFQLVRYPIDEPGRPDRTTTRGSYGGDVSDDSEATLQRGLPAEIAARFGVKPDAVQLISGF